MEDTLSWTFEYVAVSFENNTKAMKSLRVSPITQFHLCRDALSDEIGRH